MISQRNIFPATDINCTLPTSLWVKSVIVIIFFNSSPSLYVCLLFLTPSGHGGIRQHLIWGRWLEGCLGDMTRPACVYVVSCLWHGRWVRTTTCWVGFWGRSRFSARAKFAMKLEILEITNYQDFAWNTPKSSYFQTLNPLVFV